MEHTLGTVPKWECHYKGDYVFYPVVFIALTLPFDWALESSPLLKMWVTNSYYFTFGLIHFFLPLWPLIKFSLPLGVLIGDTVSHALYPLKKKRMIQVHPNLFWFVAPPRTWRMKVIIVSSILPYFDPVQTQLILEMSKGIIINLIWWLSQLYLHFCLWFWYFCNQHKPECPAQSTNEMNACFFQ